MKIEQSEGNKKNKQTSSLLIFSYYYFFFFNIHPLCPVFPFNISTMIVDYNSIIVSDYILFWLAIDPVFQSRLREFNMGDRRRTFDISK